MVMERLSAAFGATADAGREAVLCADGEERNRHAMLVAELTSPQHSSVAIESAHVSAAVHLGGAVAAKVHARLYPASY